MSAKELIILGSSAQQPTRTRNHSAYFLRWGTEGFLLDPGEGTQRQCIFANLAPPCITRIFVSHFHGDHCLGLGSMLMRLNLDQVTHPIHCYYPASGKKYFDRLRFGTAYKERISVIEHPIADAGIVDETEEFRITAQFLDHGIENLAYRIEEKPKRRFDKASLKQWGIRGCEMQQLIKDQFIEKEGHSIAIEEVSWMQPGPIFTYVADTKACPQAIEISKGADLLLIESTYLKEHQHLATHYKRLTACQAAEIAKEAGVGKLVLTHFSARYSEPEAFLQEAGAIFSQVEVAEDLKVIPLSSQFVRN